MINPSQTGTCPQCHARLPADAPQGLCPACLLAAVALPTEAGSAATPKAPPPTREQVAAAFPQLEIIELIGAGCMGYVFKARQPKLDRLVALKLLPPQLGADSAFAERFEREGRLLARLNHPNIVTVHDFGFASFPLSTFNSQLSTSSSGFFYLLMEYVDGVNLRQALRAGRFTSAQALAIVPKICEALQFAHEQGVLHRDIKPENILLDSKGRVKLADFGIAKLIGPDAAAQDLVEASNPGGRDSVEPAKERSDAPPQTPDPRPQTLPSPSGLISATAALGTPSYMAPEQRARPAEVDHRADIYSLGVVFYEMLTGELPVGQFAPPSARSPGDPRVDEVVLRALEQERERRQQSAGEMKTQVETIASSACGSQRNKTPTIGPTPSVSSIFPALSPALRWSFKITITFLFLAGGIFTWEQGSVFARGEIGFNFGVLLLPAAIGLHHRRAGWRTCALVFLWFETFVTAIAAASRLTNPYEPVIRLGYTPLTTSETWWENALWAAGYWWLARVLSQPQIKAQFSTACRIPRWKDWVVLPVALLLACAASRVYPPSPPSAIVHFGCVPVGVSNNVVFVDVNTEVLLKSLELRAELTGEGLSSTTEAAAKDYATAISGTFIYPELHGSNTLARILPPGRQTWRLGFVLPSAVLAQEAANNLRRIGPLRAEPPEASRDTLFEIHRPYGVMYRASLQVVPVDHPDQLKPPKLLFEPTSLQQPDPTPKFFTLARFTNMNGHATAWVETPLEPGESARTYLVHPDGRREPAPVMEFQNRNSLRERTTLSWRWQLPPPFTTERVDEVVAQLRDRWQGKPLSCPPGKSVNLFTLTNEFGAQVAGEVVFDRVVPDPTQPAVAAVRVRRISSLSSFISINVGSTVPAGYALRASCTGSGISRGDSSLVRSSSSDDHCTWMWPGTDFAGELAQAAVRQVQEQMARSPWLLTNGQPRTVFSVTNTTGEVYAGQLELRGATKPITRVPSPPIQPSRPIESKSPKPTALEPAQKQFVPASFTNLQGAAMMRTETPLGPGESAHAWLVHPDGRRERAWTLESLYHGAGTERTMRSWNWRLPTPFSTNQADAVVAQLRARWHGRPLVCPLGQPVTVFTLTNAAGSQVSGEVVFNRTSPNLAKPAVAEVHLQNQVGLLLFFTSQVPAGYSLHIRSGGTASQAAHATLSRSSHKDADDATCSWLWTDAGFDKVAAAKQAAVLFAQGPLLITNGQPRTVFSVTNATGEAYVGQFELRGSDYVPPVASAAPTPPRPGALAPLPLPLPPLPPANLLSDSSRPMRMPMPPGYEPPKPSTPEGIALMAKLREHYIQTTNLVVEGFTVSTTLRTNQPAFVTTNQFEIKLGRPSYYLVHWVSSPVGSHVNQGAAWSDGTGDWFTMNGSAPVKNANRGMALGGAGGVSKYVSNWLPSLFFGDAAWLQVLGDLRVEPDAVIEGEPCTVLVGSSRDNPTRLWISKQDFLLRQAEFLSTVRTDPANSFPPAGFPVGTTIRTVQTYRRVTTGQTLTPADFKFTPPDK